MALDAINTPLAVAQHNCPRLAMECPCARIIICFLVSLLGVWTKPKPCTKLQQCPAKGDSVQSVTIGQCRDSSLNQSGLCAKSGLHGCSVWPKINKGTGISQDLSYGDLTEAAYHCGCDMKSKLCVSDNGTTIMSSDRRTSGTGLNLHFFMAILLSTNKLTPEKT